MNEKRGKPWKNKAKGPAVPPEKNKGRRARKISQLTRRLALSTVPRARCTFAKLVREYDRNALSSEKFRDFNSAFRTLLSFLIAEREEDILVRLDKLEQRVAELAQ